MNAHRHNGILVTGAPRSGTSWVGRMLALATDTTYLHEPWNHRFTVENFQEEPFPHWFMYIHEGNQQPYIDRVSRMIGVRPGKGAGAGPIPIVKDPIAVFSAQWLARTYALDVVFLLRHPCAFVRSILSLGWNTGSSVFLRQADLMRDLLPEFDTELRRYAQSPEDLPRAALLWKMIYHVATIYRRQNPAWHFQRHEDLAKDPVESFRSLYSRLGLEYGDDIARQVDAHCSARNPAIPRNHWDIRRDSRKAVDAWVDYFSPQQIHSIREIVEPVSRDYYPDSEWP